MKRDFIKMHGLGNDFVIIDGRITPFQHTPAKLIAMANRRRGIGCDQFMILLPPQSPEADLYMDMYNADASVVRACGNATRCVASLLFQETGRDTAIIETISGLLRVWKDGDDVAVDFGPPRLEWQQIPTAHAVDTLHVDLKAEGLVDACCVNVGNPHAVFFVKDAEAINLSQVGPILEHNPLFPDRCNIEAVQILPGNIMRMRVWERGTGITEACGSGACATLVAAVRRGLSERRATIRLDGGDLTVEWRTDDHVILIGSYFEAYRGTFDECDYEE
ncbi:MAG: diaminopimelate epimerase [Alphaproteobacteria bacterium]|nr:diaminopimelate epimerase [Alphaproteobacteria bacterium]MBV8549580.1 diaminopimelate epimerase [Alphaproteobacteria bacterium]